jgi:hypothetical protein
MKAGLASRIPVAGIVGTLAAVGAVCLWIAEQLTEQPTFELLTIPLKLVLLAAPLFFLRDLSALLRGRPKLASYLGLALIGATLCAMAAYLPWRETFTQHFSNSRYRWYYSNMPDQHPGYYGDFSDWQKQWSRGVPHAIEGGLVVAYYGFIVAMCALRRWGLVGSAVTASAGYALLLFIPLLSGLIIWDYDTFLMGIALDSISMDLSPLCFWYAGDYSIFLHVFMLIFFGISCLFFLFNTPGNLPAPAAQPPSAAAATLPRV